MGIICEGTECSIRIDGDKEVIRRVAEESLKLDGVDQAILTLGQCRSLTTAMLRLLSENGVFGFYQAYKAQIRRLEAGMAISDVMAAQIAEKARCNTSLVHMKESIGFNTDLECATDYLGAFERVTRTSGADPFVILTARDPRGAWRSWKDTFLVGGMSEEQLFDRFVQSHQTFYKSVEDVKGSSMPHVFLPQSIFAPGNPQDIARVFHDSFELLGVDTGIDDWGNAIKGWKPLTYEQASTNARLSHFHMVEEPGLNHDVVNEPGLKRAFSSLGFIYIDDEWSHLDQAEVRLIDEMGLVDDYHNFMGMAQEQLRLA